ncbi:MAG TPA: PadR family transcriptional regulator [Candidatus Ozemobacteraceae bacterium]|nr:PadR family transcriptional regulator [Candidatus Ozemobacteraceae bacterium]
MPDSSILKEQKIRQFRKGILELAILKIISGSECYGYHIVEALKDHKISISEGTIYPLLSRLKDEEAISYRWEESTKGPPRKYYVITEKGRELLSLLLDEWRSITHGLEEILGE